MNDYMFMLFLSFITSLVILTIFIKTHEPRRAKCLKYIGSKQRFITILNRSLVRMGSKYKIPLTFGKGFQELVEDKKIKLSSLRDKEMKEIKDIYNKELLKCQQSQ